jgi:uncharacterized membrane protein
MLARGFGDQVLSQHQPIGSPSMPTQDECTMAFLAQLLQVFTGFIGPLIIYCVKHESRFVKFHALQALIWQLCYMVVVFGGMIFFFFCMFATVFHSASSGHPSNQPPPGFLLFFPLIWLLRCSAGSPTWSSASFTESKPIAASGRSIPLLANGACLEWTHLFQLSRGLLNSLAVRQFLSCV